MLRKFFSYFLIACCAVVSCKKDSSKSTKTDGVFIEINNDVRNPGLIDKDFYQIELTSYSFPETYNEPAGIQFIMDIRDLNKQYIGDIGGIINTTEIEIYVDAFKQNFDTKTILKTFVRTGSETKSIMQNKCKIDIRMKDKNDRTTAYANALNNQDVTIEKIDNKYNVTFSKLNFGNGSTFTGSARLITN